ncbi:MAG: toxin-activating lysine-acyltransferase [Pseudomonadota bacterium]
MAARFLELRYGAHIGSHLPRILAALRAGRCRLFFDRYARAVSYVSWAHVDHRVHLALQRHGPAAVINANWQGGEHAWVIDFFAHEGSLPAVLAHLRDVVFAAQAHVTYFRFRAQRRLVKQLSRADRTSFTAGGDGLWSQAAGRLVDNPVLLHPMHETLMLRLEVGRCIEALHRGGGAAGSPLWKEPGRLSTLVSLRQIRVYACADGSPGGLLTWAWLSERTLRRLNAHPLEQAHRCEWNEGTRLCIWEVLAVEEVRNELVHDLLHRLFPEERELLFYRPGPAARVQQVSRSEPAELLRVLDEVLPQGINR